MAKLTKAEARSHAAALELLAKPDLSLDDREFVLNHYHEAASHVNGAAGAFFTPLGLANDFAIDVCGRRVIDLCAGIGALSFALINYKHKPNASWDASGEKKLSKAEYVCIEINPAYVEIGRKLVPEATWICGDVMDPETFKGLGHFDCAISNPPFGKVPSVRGFQGLYTGAEADLKVVEIASRVADNGVFILPQMSSPFIFSGKQAYREIKDGKGAKFMAQTGIDLQPGCGVDTAYYKDDWKGVSPICEIVLADFTACRQPAPQQASNRTELTPQGEQLVMAGCERVIKPTPSKASQLALWD